MSDDSHGERFTRKPSGRWVERLLEYKYLREIDGFDPACTEYSILRDTSPSKPVDEETAQKLIARAQCGYGTTHIDTRIDIAVNADEVYDRLSPTYFTVIVAGLEDGEKNTDPHFIIKLNDLQNPETFVERGLYTGTEPDDPETIRHEIKQRERLK